MMADFSAVPGVDETPVARAVPAVEDAATAAVTVDREQPRRLRTLALRAAAGIGILAAWQVLFSLFAPKYIATPIGAILSIPDVFADPTFLPDIGSTFGAVLEGLLIAIVAGTVIGLAMGRLPDVNRVLGMYVGAFYAIPLIAIVPLFTVWFGYSPQARLAMVVLEAVLPIIYNVAEGSRIVSTTYLDVTRIHHVPWWRVWSGVVLPSALPYVLAGVDLAIGRSLIGAVTAEFITAIDGAGHYILFNVQSFHQNEAVIALVVVVVFALVIRALVGLIVSRGMPWYRTAKEA
jgi:ABC-type nitrate/sulfonate/bicarbonate transport system permease component